MKPFEPDGTYAGMPYRVLADSSIEVLMSSGLVKFRTLDHLLATLGNTSPAEPLGSYGMVPTLLEESSNTSALAKPLDYYSLLREAIHKAQTNSAQLRALVYERARFNFKRDILFGHPSLGLTDLVRHVNDFELAVARIEATADIEDSSLNRRIEKAQLPDDEAKPPTFGSQDVAGVDPPTDEKDSDPTVSKEIQVLPPRKHLPLHEPLAPIRLRDFPHERLEDELSSYKRLANEKFGILLFAIVFMGAVTVLGSMQWSPAKIRPDTSTPAPSVSTAAAPPALNATTTPSAQTTIPTSAAISAARPALPAAAAPSKSPFPLPSSFGVYALDSDKLIELQPLQMSIPDPRIALSAEIREPSNKVISSDKPAFILFRRDFRNNVPQKLTLRVVARMARETKIVDGKPIMRTLEGGPWRVRNISRALTISPIPDQPEMLMARLEDGVSLSPGRYVLVINRTGYDFVVAGQASSSEFCLEEFETTNGSVLTQCRLPADSTHNGTSSRRNPDH